ncbi:MAG TPA: translation initiation factor [Caldithrix abyssi]|uniref:Translation initiation factor n=1 Tax=Caldithrix abyssi TaxID=187145 RepID=A0A7V4WWB5_CALAY|nr:translation initiation factor [Caldithrix abyssi]
MNNRNRNIIYSTDADWQKDEENKPETVSVPINGQTAHLYRDRKGRGGKTVTVIKNLQGDLKTLQKELQRHCGSGGTLKGNQIEIQGDHRQKVAEYLAKKGYKYKFIGG